MPSFPTTWSLGAIGERLEPLPNESHVGNEPLSHRALRSWLRLAHHCGLQKSQPKKLPDFLTPEQHLSYRVLRDWWTAYYFDGVLIAKAVGELFGSKLLFKTIVPIFFGGGEHMGSEMIGQELSMKAPLKDLAKLIQIESNDSDIDLVESYYHRSMKELFELEFSQKISYDPPREYALLVDQRQKHRIVAASAAFCQQYGWNVYSSFQNATQANEDSADSGLGQTISASRSLAHEGPVVEPCPWLNKKRGDENKLPHYLWSVKEGCVVQTSTLQHQPAYVAISHTWGRWRKETDAPIEVSGSLWPIPENTRFEVSQLPDIIRRLVLNFPDSIEYVWLDLVCIPQDGSEIGRQEIARQAEIFQSATYAMAWFSDIENFEGLGRILDYLAARMLDLDPRLHPRLEECKRRTLGSTIGHQCELFIEEKMNPWFTSLWTLQEICLRPDMWLCARFGDLLLANKSTPMPFSGMIALLEYFRKAVVDVHFVASMHLSQETSGIRDTIFWYARSELRPLLHLDISALIELAETRECTERRAEAIMSALGVTEWFSSALARDPNAYLEFEKNLVLDKYPLAFVQELSRKSPKDFFATKQRYYFDGTNDNFLPTTERQGALLPFARPRVSGLGLNLTSRSIGDFLRSSKVHETLSTWTVQGTGAVYMEKACVLHLNASRTEQILLAKMLPEFMKESDGRLSEAWVERLNLYQSKEEKWVNLNLWIEKRSIPTHAVVIDFCNDWETKGLYGSGVILEQHPGSGILCMLTAFVFYDENSAVNIKDVQKVNWVVM